MKNTFKIIAFLEGVSYILLMTVGLYFKYQIGDPTYVKLLGMPHGILFVSYILLVFLIKENENWKIKDLGIVLDIAKNSNFSAPITAAALQQFVAASGSGLGLEDDAAVAKVYAHNAGIELPKKQKN